MHQPLISIIAPVYKVEQYLHKTIGSVLAQTYTNWELLLIDDGSPDKSGAICDEYAEKDPRIQVFHKPNGGVSSARNVGLEKAKGEWVCFLDSDDWWDDSFLQNFVSLMDMDADADLYLQSFYIENEYKHRTEFASLPNRTFDTATELIVFLEKADKVHNGFLWHRLFKHNIISDYGLQFPDGISFAEDGCFFFQYMAHCQNAVMTSAGGYHYRMAPGSLTSRGKVTPCSTYCTLLEAYTSNLRTVLDKDKASQDMQNDILRYCWRLTESWMVNGGLADKTSYIEAHRFTKNIILNNKMHLMRYMPISLKILSKLCISNPSLVNYHIIKLIAAYRRLIKKIKAHI